MVESEFMAEMAFESDSQGLRISDDRKKLDGFEAILNQNMDQKHLLSDSKYNVRNSLAWDSAFFTSPGVLEPDELFRSVNSRIGANEEGIFGHEEEILLASGTLEPKVTQRVDKCDLRKSLAWDDAFFTNAGVLNTEELSIVNRGFRNPGIRLAGIDEDVSKSTESSFSVESGASSLKSLEIDLFEDVRVSRHRSDKFSVSESNQDLQRQKDKLDAYSRIKIKGIPVSRRQNMISNSAERYAKTTSLSAPSKKQLSARNSSVKPPKSADRLRNIQPVLTKKSSFGASFSKVGTPKASSAESRFTNPKKITPWDSKPSPKSSALVSPHEPDSCLLSNSDSTFGTPSRCESEPQSSCQSSQELSMTKSSYFTSPESSIDKWSSELPSTSMAKRPNNPKAFLGMTCRQVQFESVVSRDSPLSGTLTNPLSRTSKSREKTPSNHRNNKTPLRTVSFPYRMSANTKPSSHRSPSPKLGYSDESKSSVPIRNRRSAQFNSGKEISITKPRIARATTQTLSHSGSALQLTQKNPVHVIEVGDENSTSATIKICFPSTSSQSTSYEDFLEAKKPEVSEEAKNMEIVIAQKPGKNPIEGFKKMSFSLDESNKENIYCFGDQVDDLGTRFGMIDFGGDLVIEVKVNRTTPDAQSAVLTLKL